MLPGRVPPSGTLPLAGPDALVVMCIRGGVNARSDSFSDFHSLKKIEYKSSFIGNDYQTVGYLGCVSTRRDGSGFFPHYNRPNRSPLF